MRLGLVLALLVLTVVTAVVHAVNITFIVNNVTTSYVTYSPLSTAGSVAALVNLTYYKPASTSGTVTASMNYTYYAPATAASAITNVTVCTEAVPPYQTSAVLPMSVSVLVTSPVGERVYGSCPRYVFPWRGNVFDIIALGDPACLSAVVSIPELNVTIRIYAGNIVQIETNKTLVELHVTTEVEKFFLRINATPRTWTIPETVHLIVRSYDLCLDRPTRNITVYTRAITKTSFAWVSEKKLTLRPSQKFAVRVRLVFVNTTVPAYRERVYINGSYCGETDVNGYVTCTAFAPPRTGTFRYVIVGEHSVDYVVVNVTVRTRGLVIPIPGIPARLLIYAAVTFLLVTLGVVALTLYLRRRRAIQRSTEYT